MRATRAGPAIQEHRVRNGRGVFARAHRKLRPMVSRDAVIAVYMMSNRKHGTLYTGVTSRFIGRIEEHRMGVVDGFTKKYGLKRLVWYELHETMLSAIRRETALKRYKRDWKINLIERENPHWTDLFPEILKSWFGKRRA
jgi:putative endonuclease